MHFSLSISGTLDEVSLGSINRVMKSARKVDVLYDMVRHSG